MAAQLRTVHGDRLFVINDQATIGRSHENTVQIPKQSVSKRQAKIEIKGATTAMLTDEESKNGTWVGDEHIRNGSKQLVHGDTIRFGKDEDVYVFEFLSLLRPATPPKATSEFALPEPDKRSKSTNDFAVQPDDDIAALPFQPLEAIEEELPPSPRNPAPPATLQFPLNLSARASSPQMGTRMPPFVSRTNHLQLDVRFP